MLGGQLADKRRDVWPVRDIGSELRGLEGLPVAPLVIVGRLVRRGGLIWSGLGGSSRCRGFGRGGLRGGGLVSGGRLGIGRRSVDRRRGGLGGLCRRSILSGRGWCLRRCRLRRCYWWLSLDLRRWLCEGRRGLSSLLASSPVLVDDGQFRADGHCLVLGNGDAAQNTGDRRRNLCVDLVG